MKQYDKDFVPESVDEQIEQLLSRSGVQLDKATPQERMVHDLQDVYTEEEVLAHVWNSLVEHMENKNNMQQQDLQNEQSEQQRSGNVERSHSLKPLKQTRYPHLNLVAAVLLAALVVGSMVWVLTFLRHQDTQVATSPQPQNVSPSGIYIGAGNGVFRIDRQTHKVIWRYKFPAPPLNACGVTGNCALFAGNLVLANNMLYVPLRGGMLYALDANNGAVRWSHNFKMFLSRIAMVNGQLCAISNEGTDSPDFYVHMFNPANGAVDKQYHFSRSSGGSIGSTNYAVAGQTLYTDAGNGLYAFNLANGKRLWQQQIDQKHLFSGLQVVSGVVYASSLVNANAPSGYVYAFNASTGEQVWQTATVGNVFLATVAENVVYLSAEDPNLTTNPYTLYAYSAQNGKQLWQHHSLGISASANNTVVNAGVVYIAGSYGENTGYQGLIALNAKDGSIKWQTPNNAKSPNASEPASGPVLVDGTLYVGDTSLHVLNAKDGSALWNVAIGGLDVSPVIVTIVVAP